MKRLKPNEERSPEGRLVGAWGVGIEVGMESTEEILPAVFLGR